MDRQKPAEAIVVAGVSARRAELVMSGHNARDAPATRIERDRAAWGARSGITAALHRHRTPTTGGLVFLSLSLPTTGSRHRLRWQAPPRLTFCARPRHDLPYRPLRSPWRMPIWI